jgi:23S rRNA pseudouridine1911/1915/1917 synthase
MGSGSSIYCRAVRATYTVTAEENGLTVSAVLRRRVSSLAWARAKRLCESGKVQLDGARVTDAAARVRTGQELRLDEAAPAPVPELRVEIAYEDAHVVVIDKPTGVSSVPFEKREGGTAMDLLRDAWRRKGIRGVTDVPLHVIHRIDKETSGLLAFAKTKLAERTLQALFRAHDIERTYLCVVHGAAQDRRIESRLVDDRGDGLRGTTRRPNQGKRAVTHVRVVERLAETTLCEVKLETGKTHQIRIHLAEDGHPLVGERVYIRDYTARGHEPIACPRLLLHAATLGFVHPITRAKISLSSPLPPDFERELARLRR